MATAIKILIICTENTSYPDEDDGKSHYNVQGAILPDGRLFTWGTGVDGRDSLWASLDAYEPNGLAAVATFNPIDEECEITLDALRDADLDNTMWGADKSLLTAAERDAAQNGCTSYPVRP